MKKENLKIISQKEEVSLTLIENELKNKRAILLKNINRKINPVLVGKKFKCKVNVNLGLSTNKSNLKEEIEKIKTAVDFGADTVMDLSVGEKSKESFKILMENVNVPIGTVPIYSMIENEEDFSKLSKNLILETIHRQAEDGVDFMTIHAGFRKKDLKYLKNRLIPVVSRGGALISKFMSKTKKENPFYEYFEDILKILKKYSVTISIGDGLRPGCLKDATDKAQLSELDTISKLNEVSLKEGVYAMIEGPGHIPLNQIEKNVILADEKTNGAPLYFLGPLTIDNAMGYDHIVGAIGASIAGHKGVSLLCALTPSEHLGLPTIEDIKQGTIAFKIAANSVNVAKGFKSEILKNEKISKARVNFDWEKQFELSIDKDYARKRYKELNKKEEKFCSMCGNVFCAMRNSKQVVKI